jgi:hypothetical protein
MSVVAAVGDVVPSGNAFRSVCLMKGLAAVNGAPTQPTDGVPAYVIHTEMADKGCFFSGRAADVSRIHVASTAGSGGAMSVTLKVWGYITALGKWVVLASLNGGTGIAGGAANNIAYSERVQGLGLADRIYLEATAIAGTGTTVDAVVSSARTVSF